MFIVVTLATWGVTTAGAFGTLVSSFLGPSLPDGMEFYNGSLYFGGLDAYYAYKTTTTGSIERTYNTPWSTTYGIAAGDFGGTGYIWQCGQEAPYLINLISITTGSRVSSFMTPNPWVYFACLAYRPGYLYYNAGGMRLVHPTTGSVYASYNPVYLDLDDDPAGGYLWGTGEGRWVYKTTLTGSPLASFYAGSYLLISGGCAFDGSYVYVGDASTAWVYKFETEEGSALAPASLGRIKALFR